MTVTRPESNDQIWSDPWLIPCRSCHNLTTGAYASNQAPSRQRL